MATCALVVFPATASAKPCAGSVIRHGGAITLTATDISASGGMTCRHARTVIRRYFDKKLRDYHGCAIPAVNGRTCRVGLYRCSTVGTYRVEGRCFARSGKVTVFAERNDTDA